MFVYLRKCEKFINKFPTMGNSGLRLGGGTMTTPPDNIEQNHWQEWLASNVDPGIIALNVRPLEGELSGVDGEYSLTVAEFLNIPIRPGRWINRQGFKNLAYSFQLLTYSASCPTGGAS